MPGGHAPRRAHTPTATDHPRPPASVRIRVGRAAFLVWLAGGVRAARRAAAALCVLAGGGGGCRRLPVAVAAVPGCCRGCRRGRSLRSRGGGGGLEAPPGPFAACPLPLRSLSASRSCRFFGKLWFLGLQPPKCYITYSAFPSW